MIEEEKNAEEKAREWNRELDSVPLCQDYDLVTDRYAMQKKQCNQTLW